MTKNCDECGCATEKYTFSFGVEESPTTSIELQRIKESLDDFPDTMHPMEMAEELRKMYPKAEIKCTNVSVN